MIGCYDFCGHYEWTFAWLEAQGGPALVKEYWDQAIHRDSQRHARAQIIPHGLAGMKKYWNFTLEHEAAGFALHATEDAFRIDMHECPSKGFLIRNGLLQYRDYCDHCMGWIGPLMQEAGFVIDHQHNHQGQCWWEIRSASDPAPPSAPGTWTGPRDVRLQPTWTAGATPTDTYQRATDADAKATS